MTHSVAQIPVATALRRLEELPLDWGVQQVALAEAAGRVLAESLQADRDFPPFHRVAMDGIAVSAAALAEGRREFRVVGIQGAGEPPLRLGDSHEAVEVMTGAVLPEGAAAVIPVEELARERATVRLTSGGVPKPGQNVHVAGSDARAGDLLLQPGLVLHGPALAVAASIGAGRLTVRRRPRLALLATGSELVGVDELPAPYQIRVSNLTALRGSLDLHGYAPAWSGRVGDNRVELGRLLSTLLEGHDVLVLSGGVSRGRYDHVPGLLAELGCHILFHGVRQRPGRPLLAATGPRGQLVLALPGNPVTTVICLHRYLLPLLQQREGRPSAARRVRLATALRWGRPLALFLGARLESAATGLPLAWPLPTGGSGDFAPLAASDGFLELEEGRPGWEAGEEATFWPWMPR